MSRGLGGLIPRAPKKKDSSNWKRESGLQVPAKKNRLESEGRGNFEYSVVSVSQYVLWIISCRIMDGFWKETTSVKRKFKEKKKKNPTTLIKPKQGQEGRRQCYVTVCAIGDERNLLGLRRALEHGTNRLISGLETKSLGVEHGAAATQEALPEEGEFASMA